MCGKCVNVLDMDEVTQRAVNFDKCDAALIKPQISNEVSPSYKCTNFKFWNLGDNAIHNTSWLYRVANLKWVHPY